MTDRDRMKARIMTVLSFCGAVDESTAMTLWVIASKITDESERVSVRYVRSVLEVLFAEGRVVHDDVEGSHHEEPTRFWMRSEVPVSDPCERRNSVREAHEHEEMQLPSLDLDEDGADLGSDG